MAFSLRCRHTAVDVDIKPKEVDAIGPKTNSFAPSYQKIHAPPGEVARAQAELARSLKEIAKLPAAQPRYDAARTPIEGTRIQVEVVRTHTEAVGVVRPTTGDVSRSEPNQSEPVICNSVPSPQPKSENVSSMHAKDIHPKMLIQSKSLGEYERV